MDEADPRGPARVRDVGGPDCVDRKRFSFMGFRVVNGRVCRAVDHHVLAANGVTDGVRVGDVEVCPGQGRDVVVLDTGERKGHL